MSVLKLLGIILIMVPQAYGAPYLHRQWSRATLQSQHLGFRHLNRMTPILHNDLVIVGNGTDGVKAFNRRSGHQQWALKLVNGVEGGAFLDDGQLFFGSNDGHFYAVKAQSGQILWQYKVNSESLTKPLVHNSFVYHITGNNTLYAFNKDTGESLWVKTNSAYSNMSIRGQTSPVVENDILYVGYSDGTFSAINALNGRELWSKRIGDDKKFTDVDATAFITPSCLLVSSYANSLYCLDKSNGNIQWRHDFGGYFPVSVIDNIIYFPTVDNEIHILEEGSGKLLRKIVNINGLSTAIAEIGDYIIYGETAGSVVVRKKGSLDKVTSFNSGLGVYSKPVISKDQTEIYFISNGANIFRLDLSDRPRNPFLWSQQ